jgi:hypothetical protein
VFKGNKAMMGDAFFNSLRNLDGDFRVGLGCIYVLGSTINKAVSRLLFSTK